MRSFASVALLVVALLGAVAPAAPASAAVTTSAEGDVMPFGPAGGTVTGLSVEVLEDPGLATTTDANGHWRIDGIPVGSAATFFLHGDVRYPIQTATFTMPAGGLDHVSFQSPSTTIVGAFEAYLHITSDPTRCHLASTVTRQGFSLYGGAPDGTHGEPGATVTISPQPAHGGTPIYFNGSRFDTIWPDRSLAATTADGGVLFVNVSPGTYTLQAHKAGAVIAPVTVRCRAGVLSNASPPWGLQVTSGGLGPTDTVPFPTTTTTTATTTTRPVGSTSVPTTMAVATTTVVPPATAGTVAARPATARAGTPSYTG